MSEDGDDTYFGVCPECGKTDGYINIGREHWFYCKEHKVKWWAGSNLFRGWKDETEAEQEATFNDLGFGEYRIIQTYHAGEKVYNFDEMTTPELVDFFGDETKSNLQIIRYEEELSVVSGIDLDFNPEDGIWERDADVFVQRLGHKRAYIGKVVDPKTLSREQIMGCVKEAYEENLF
jgi:hypothetical protein